MTDQSHPAEPQSAEPQHGGVLPRRQTLGGALPQRETQAQDEPLPTREPLPQWDAPGQRDPLPRSAGSFFERAVPDKTDELPRLTFGEPLPKRASDLPQRGSDLPQRGSDLPQRGSDLPQHGSDLPPRGSEPLPKRASDLPPRASEPLPKRASDLPPRASEPLPKRASDLPPRASEPLPKRASDLPPRGSDLPQRGSDLPQRGGPQAGGLGALPRRTTRTQRSGRHRSPHRLSVASEAPALVLAVPGTAAADTADIGAQVAYIAAQSCPGVDIRVGYLDGENLTLAECLLSDEADTEGQDQFPSVIVPLLVSPSPAIDDKLQQMAARPPLPAIVAPHLGPHPLIAEALHGRLAEAGLARQARSSGLSISADGRGIVVLAGVGEEAASAASVAAVLLASRLSVPVVPASLGDPSSIVDAVNMLTASGAARPVLSPCLIGLEANVAVLDDLSAALDAPCAPVLGAHQAIGQLVAIRYGTALASLSLAG